MERDPQWSPDGKSIAYLSDESGEYALHLRPQNGAGEVKKIELKPGFYRSPQFSPDSKKIALVDSFQRLWYVDLETKKQVEVAQDTYQMRNGDIAGAWSPDSKWLAYSKVLPNELSAIHLYSLADAQIHAGDRRHERRHQSGVRQGRQVSLLHGEHQLRRRPRRWIFTRWAAPRPVRFTWPFWTRRSLLRSLPRATRRRRQTTRNPPTPPSRMQHRRAAERQAGRRRQAETRRAGRQDRPGRNRPAHPVRADAAAALHGAAGGEGGHAAGARGAGPVADGPGRPLRA